MNAREPTALCCTVVTINHLPYARVLMASVQQHWPEAQRHVLVVDAAPDMVRKLREPFEVTSALEGCRPGFRKRAFLNGPGAFSCMFKPAFVARLLRETGAAIAVYADADSRFYARPDALLESAATHPFTITPHTLAPLPAGATLRTNGDIARAGTYNGGLFAVRNDPDALACMDLWTEGMWTDGWQSHQFAWDQIWLPLLRHHHPQTNVLLAKAYNVAYWNVHERGLRTDVGGRINTEDGALAHFHFSFFDRSRPDMLVHRWSQVVPPNNAAVAGICREYAVALDAANIDGAFEAPYGFGHFNDGEAILELHRNYYRTQVAASGTDDDDPFDPAFSVGRFSGLRRVRSYCTRRARAVRFLERMGDRVGRRLISHGCNR